MNIVILLYLFFNAFAYTMGMEIRPAQEFFFQMSSLVLILSSLVFQPKQKKESLFENKLNICILTAFCWALIVFLKDKMGWSILLNIFLGLGVYLTVIRNLEYKDVKFIIKNSMWIVVFAIVYLAFQYLGFDIRNQGTKCQTGVIPKCSTFGLEAHYGIYLAMVFPLMLGISFINDVSNKWIPAIIGLIGLMFIALLPAHSTGACLGLLVAVLVYLWHKARLAFWWAIVPLLVGIVAFLVIVDNPMGMQKSRLMMWGEVIQDSHLKPFGHGLDSFRVDDREGATRYFKYAFNDTTVRVRKVGVDWIMQGKPEKEFLDNIEKNKKGDSIGTLNFWDSPHNESIQIFYELGFPGLILLGFITFFICRIFKFSMRKPLTVACFASLVSIFIFNLFQFGFHVARIAHVIPIVLGMFVVSARDE